MATTGVARPAEAVQAFDAREVRSAWKATILSEARNLREDAQVAEATQKLDPAGESIARHVRRLLDDAVATATSGGWRDDVATWLHGGRIVRAWSLVHEAEALLYLVYSEAVLQARKPALLASVHARLEPSDARRPAYEKALAESEQAPEREMMREIRATLNRITDDAHGRVRSFRNVALGATVFLALGMLLLAFDAPGDPWLPVNHGAKPWVTVWQIELVGALGGLLAGVTALRSMQGFSGPYSLPVVMAALKIPAGALTGLLGALWMQNGVFSGLSAQDGVKILAYVALFGFSQQALTGFADKQAGQLLGQAKGKRSSP